MAAAAARGPREVAGVARHLVVAVRELGRHAGAPLAGAAVVAGVHQLGARRLLVVVRVARRDRVLHQRHLPFELGIDAPSAGRACRSRHSKRRRPSGVRSSDRSRAAGRRRRPRGAQRRVACPPCRGNRRSRSPSRRPPRRRCGRCRGRPARSGSRRTACRRRRGSTAGARPSGTSAGSSSATTLAVRVEQVARAVALEHRAEIPAVAVVVGELRVLELRVERRDIAQEFRIAPLAADRAPPRDCGRGSSRASASVGYFCFFGHMDGRVGLVVPHDVAEKLFTNMLGWCMWQTMHWDVGIARVKRVLERMARLVLAGWSDRRSAVSPSWPNARIAARSAPDRGRWHRPRGTPRSRTSDSRRAGRWCRGTTGAGRSGASW